MTTLELNALTDILLNLIDKHDKTYEYSDDMGAYTKGRNEKKAIISHMVVHMGYDVKNAEQYYSFITGPKR
jgi:hypothetical protein